eukprot:jgi/Tetstr1/435595/TSEL_024498.t1
MAGPVVVSATERAELHAVAEQLGCALAQSPLMPPAELPEARALVARAERLASAAAAFRADLGSVVGGEALSLPRMLEAGGALHQAVATARVAGHEFYEDAVQEDDEDTQLRAVVGQLSRFQIRSFGRPQLRAVAALSEACLATEQQAHVKQGLHALLAWAQGTGAVLREAWEQYRLVIQNERSTRPSIDYWASPLVELGADQHWADRVRWAELYPVPPKAVRPHGWDVEDEEEREESSQGSDEEDAWEGGWCLSPKLAWVLCRELWSSADLMMIEQQAHSSVIPEVAELYAEIPGWMDQMAQCAARMAVRLQKGTCRPLPNCTAEAVVLRSSLDYLDDMMLHDDYFAEFLAEDHPSHVPSSKFDFDIDPLRDWVFEGAHVDLLFQWGWTIDSINNDWMALDAVSLHPAEWFKPFQPDRFTDHISFTPSRRIVMQQRAASILRGSALFSQEPTADLVAAQMGDVELLRVSCCAKAAVDNAEAEEAV